MKKNLIFILLLAANFLAGQDAKLKIEGEKVDNKNRLFWTPDLPEHWIHMANEGSYFLDRFLKEEPGRDVSSQEYLTSKTTFPVNGVQAENKKLYNISYSDFQEGYDAWINNGSRTNIIPQSYEGSHCIFLKDSILHGNFKMDGYKTIEVSCFATGSYYNASSDSLFIEFYNGLSWKRIGSFGKILNNKYYKLEVKYDLSDILIPDSVCKIRLRGKIGISVAGFYLDGITVKTTSSKDSLSSITEVSKNLVTNLSYIDSTNLHITRDTNVLKNIQIGYLPIEKATSNGLFNGWQFSSYELVNYISVDPSQAVYNGDPNTSALKLDAGSFGNQYNAYLQKNFNLQGLNEIFLNFDYYRTGAFNVNLKVEIFNGTQVVKTVNEPFNVSSNNNFSYRSLKITLPAGLGNSCKIKITPPGSSGEWYFKDLVIIGIDGNSAVFNTSPPDSLFPFSFYEDFISQGYDYNLITYANAETNLYPQFSGTISTSSFCYTGSSSYSLSSSSLTMKDNFDFNKFKSIELDFFVHNKSTSSSSNLDSLIIEGYDGANWIRMGSLGAIARNTYSYVNVRYLLPINTKKIRFRRGSATSSSSIFYIDDILISGSSKETTNLSIQQITKGQIQVVRSKVTSKKYKIYSGLYNTRFLFTSLELGQQYSEGAYNYGPLAYDGTYSRRLSQGGIIEIKDVINFGYDYYKVGAIIGLSALEAGDNLTFEYSDNGVWKNFATFNFSELGQNDRFYRIEAFLNKSLHTFNINSSIRIKSNANLTNEYFNVDCISVVGSSYYNPSKLIQVLVKKEIPADLSYFDLQEKFLGGTDNNLTLNEKQQLIHDLMYTNLEENMAPENAKLSEVNMVKQKLQSKYFTVVKLVEQDPVCALVAKMGFVDSTIIAGNSYDYRIWWTDGTDTIISDLVSISGNNKQIQWDDNIHAVGKQGKVEILWNIDLEEGPFSYYNINRKDLANPGAGFIKLNQQPFVFLSSSSNRFQTAKWTDTTMVNGSNVLLGNYVYQVEGVGYYGNHAFSNFDTAHAHPFLPLDWVYIDTLIYETNGALLNWNVPSGVQPYLSKINVLKQVDEYGGLETLFSLNGSARSVTLPLDYMANNYIVQAELVSDYGHYNSLPVFVQFPDSIAPNIPDMPFGIISSIGEVNLAWIPNTDPDILGYNLYYSNENTDSAAYTRINNTPILDTFFRLNIDPELSNEFIFYKITALDFRQNESLKSGAAMLERPDNVEYRAIITNLNGVEEGIRVAWEEPDSSRVSHYVLQRRPKSILKWDTLFSWTPGAYEKLPLIAEERIAPRFVDQTELEWIPYLYRIITISNSGVVSYSDEREVRPYDNGQRGEIGQLKFRNLNQAAGPDLTNFLIGWDYKTKYDNTLKEFKVYIHYPGTAADQYYLVKTIKPGQSASQATSLKGGSQYAVVNALSKSESSQSGSSYKFKIVAVHHDGGYAVYEGGMVDENIKRN